MSQLRSRGFLSDEDISTFNHLSITDLTLQLDSDDAVERSAAIRLLSQSAHLDSSIPRSFAEQLKREAKLYTKIELCEALQSGGVETAHLLIPLLGTIGRNQHQTPSLDAFKKSSYPLPRDIVARVLARMDPRILPVLTSVIHDGPRIQLVEAIDAVGFMCFYSPAKATDQLATLRALIVRFNDSPTDDLTRWKIVRALESFNHPDSLSILRDIVAECEIAAMRQEAHRSISIAVNLAPM